MLNVLFRTIAGFTVFLCLCNSHTLLGDPLPEHDGLAESDKDDDGVVREEAKQRIVESRPPIGALGSLLQKMQPSMTTDGFSKLVEKANGLNDVQKSALKSSFQNIAKASDTAGAYFLQVVGSAIAELDRNPATPPSSGTPGPQPPNQAQPPGQAGQQPGSQDSKVSDQIKELQNQFKQVSDERKGQSDRLRDLLGRNQRNDGQNQQQGQNNGQNNGLGQNGLGGQGGLGQGLGGQNSGGDSGGGADAKALKALTALAKEKKTPTPSSTRSGSDSQSQSQKDQQQAQAAKDQKRSASSSDDSSTTDDAAKKKKDKKPTDDLANAMANQNADANQKPEYLQWKGNNFGPKSAGRPMPKSGGSGWGGGGMGGMAGMGGGGAGGGLAKGAGAFGGANVKGNGGAGGGGADLGSMRFDSDFAGYGGGGKLGTTGPIYMDGGSAGAASDSDAGSGLEAELANSAAANAVVNRYVPNSMQVEASSADAPLTGNIISRNFGKQLKEPCETAPGVVAACHHPRAKAFLGLTAS